MRYLYHFLEIFASGASMLQSVASHYRERQRDEGCDPDDVIRMAATALLVARENEKKTPILFWSTTSVIPNRETQTVSNRISKTFQEELIAVLPKLRMQALSLTHNSAAADDLVQDAVCNALAGQDSFLAGSNFAGWMYRILRNRFISNLRKRQETTDIDDVPEAALAITAPHEDRLILNELGTALSRLPSDQREALIMVVIQGMSYEDLAAFSSCAVGTAKTRVFRARRQLEIWLMGENIDVHKAKMRTQLTSASTQRGSVSTCTRDHPVASRLLS